MIDETTGQINNHFYSFNIGRAHVVGFSSEFYYFTEYGFSQIANQYEWLEQDLREANKPENKAKYPWLILMAHRPMYCSTRDADDCAQNESIVSDLKILFNISNHFFAFSHNSYAKAFQSWISGDSKIFFTNMEPILFSELTSM